MQETCYNILRLLIVNWEAASNKTISHKVECVTYFVDTLLKQSYLTDHSNLIDLLGLFLLHNNLAEFSRMMKFWLLYKDMLVKFINFEITKLKYDEFQFLQAIKTWNIFILGRKPICQKKWKCLLITLILSQERIFKVKNLSHNVLDKLSLELNDYNKPKWLMSYKKN